MHKKYLGAAVALILVTAVALPVWAQSDRVPDAEARAQFDTGRAAYDARRFEDAAQAFRRAYVLSPRYQLLYNIGQAELRAEHNERALGAFEGFLRQAPEADPRRSEVQERVNVLRGMGVTPTVEEAPARQASPNEPAAVEPWSESKVGPWIMIGAGAAGVITGAVLMGVGMSKAQEVADAPAGSRWVKLEDTADTANLFWGMGIATSAVGLVAVGGGIAWAIAGSNAGSNEGERSPRRRVSLRVGIGSVAIGGAF